MEILKIVPRIVLKIVLKIDPKIILKIVHEINLKIVPLAGNALVRVQRVHAPADLLDITFCTRWFWGF